MITRPDRSAPSPTAHELTEADLEATILTFLDAGLVNEALGLMMSTYGERIARFLMNAMLAAGGYPWTIIRVEDRNAYLAGLEAASVDMNVRPFAAFLAERVRWSIKKSV